MYSAEYSPKQAILRLESLPIYRDIRGSVTAIALHGATALLNDDLDRISYRSLVEKSSIASPALLASHYLPNCRFSGQDSLPAATRSLCQARQFTFHGRGICRLIDKTKPRLRQTDIDWRVHQVDKSFNQPSSCCPPGVQLRGTWRRGAAGPSILEYPEAGWLFSRPSIIKVMHTRILGFYTVLNFYLYHGTWLLSVRWVAPHRRPCSTESQEKCATGEYRRHLSSSTLLPMRRGITFSKPVVRYAP